jgi:hypothetical protein
MSSSEPPKFFELPRGFPVTPEALQVLRENPIQPGKDFWEQFQRVHDLLLAVEDGWRKRRTLEGCEPFEL